MGTMRFTIGGYWFDIPASAYIIDFGVNADNSALPLFGADKCVFMLTREYYDATKAGALGFGNAWMWQFYTEINYEANNADGMIYFGINVNAESYTRISQVQEQQVEQDVAPVE